MTFTFRLPDVGEGIHEAEIVSYEVNVGDDIKEDQVIIKIETDKAVVELPSPATGKVVDIPHSPGDTVEVGDSLIVFETEGPIEQSEEVEPVDESAVSSSEPETKETSGSAEPKKNAPQQQHDSGNGHHRRPLATPHTRRLARELNVDLAAIQGSGRGGRITDDDVERAAKTASEPETVATTVSEPQADTPEGTKDADSFGPTRRVPLKGIRKRISEAMELSYRTIPHVTHSDEVDVTELFGVLRKQKPVAEEQGIKLTPLAFICRAAVSALKKFPEVNASLDEKAGEIIFKDYYHIGIAADSGHGLMVPVVHNADQKSILEIADTIHNLAKRVRTRTVTLEELQGGTFALTNIGALGGTHATPIIQHPQAAILVILAARQKPVVVDDTVQIRTIMPLTIAFDHRILDGAIMARFMNHIKSLLQDPMRMLVELV